MHTPKTHGNSTNRILGLLFATFSIAGWTSDAMGQQVGQATTGIAKPLGRSLPGIRQDLVIGKSTTTNCSRPGACNPGDCTVYTFTGSGSWENEANWLYGIRPPKFIKGCYTIKIDPVGSTNSVMIFPQAILDGGTIIVETGKHLIIPGSLTILE